MAIGSSSEIGKNFGIMKDMSPADIQEWFQYMRDNWQPNLHAGWAVLVHKLDNNPYYTHIQKERIEPNSDQ